MTNEAYSSSPARRAQGEPSGAAVGFILFAAVMMIMAGVFQAIQGLVGIFENEFYVPTRNYLFQFDATTWGWTHLLVGLLVAFAGWGLLSGRTWARTVSLSRSSSSSLMISPWKFGWLNPNTINCTGPMAMASSSLFPAWWSDRVAQRAAVGGHGPDDEDVQGDDEH